MLRRLHSPQRTPVLYQAGASTVAGNSPPSMRNAFLSMALQKRSLATSSLIFAAALPPCGRDPAQILIFTMMTVITAVTHEAAQEKLRDYLSYVSEEGALDVDVRVDGARFLRIAAGSAGTV